MKTLPAILLVFQCGLILLGVSQIEAKPESGLAVFWALIILFNVSFGALNLHYLIRD